MTSNIQIKRVKKSDIHNHFLKGFVRYQETKQVLYLKGEALEVKADDFKDDWSDHQKEGISMYLRECLEKGGGVVAALEAGHVVGFANVENQFFGEKSRYVPMPFMHVSGPHRGKKIGRNLFRACCDIARELGADKLYIGAHPAVETQSFYRSMGCVLAEEINQAIYEKEPLDLQLEKVL